MNRDHFFAMLMFASLIPSAYSQGTAADSSRVMVSNGRIRVIARDVPLRQLLDEVRQATGISFSAFSGAEAELISVAIDDTPLEQGLRILLSCYDSVLLYSANDTGRAELKKVWVYHKGQATGLEPASVEAVAGTKQLKEKLNDPDRAVRGRAFEAMLARPGIVEKDAIARAVLGERDDDLRASMIASVQSSSLRLPTEFWGSLSNDPSEHIRLLVLDALEGTPQARDLATLALTDPSPHVKLRAKDILDTLGVASPTASGCDDGCVHQK